MRAVLYPMMEVDNFSLNRARLRGIVNKKTSDCVCVERSHAFHDQCGYFHRFCATHDFTKYGVVNSILLKSFGS